MRYTTWVIRLLLINGVVVSFILTQKLLDWNLLPVTIENFAWALVAAFQIILISCYCAAMREEEADLTNAVTKIEELLRERLGETDEEEKNSK